MILWVWPIRDFIQKQARKNMPSIDKTDYTQELITAQRNLIDTMRYEIELRKKYQEHLERLLKELGGAISKIGL